ncbi:hypothetical protein B0H11DRAFT_2283320 [Mycena galericulata]|nr:hypothetical protein B0H11DRAFT_2283320 [Mycena galericulata]
MSFPELPFDIVECILIHSASSSPSAALTICLVSSWARNIAIPQLHHTVVLASHGQHLAFLANNRLASPQPVHGPAASATIPLGHHVRHILLDSKGADMHALYALCPNLVSLAIPVSRLIGFSTERQSFPSLTRLDILSPALTSVSPTSFAANPVRARPWAPLTHLRLRLHAPSPSQLPFPNTNLLQILPLEHMPALTHLAHPLPVPTPWQPADAAAPLNRCPSLRMLVIVVPHATLASHLAPPFRAHDPRLYIYLDDAGLDRTTQWRHEVDGAMSTIWERASQFRASLAPAPSSDQ